MCACQMKPPGKSMCECMGTSGCVCAPMVPSPPHILSAQHGGFPQASSRSTPLTIFRMAALEWLAAVEMSSKDPVGGRFRVRLRDTSWLHTRTCKANRFCPALLFDIGIWGFSRDLAAWGGGMQPCRHTSFTEAWGPAS